MVDNISSSHIRASKRYSFPLDLLAKDPIRFYGFHGQEAWGIGYDCFLAFPLACKRIDWHFFSSCPLPMRPVIMFVHTTQSLLILFFQILTF